jgi:hypothetical protein
MTEPTQTTIYGAEEPLQRPIPHRSPEYVAVPLFTAPDAMRGQLHMPTDTPSERHAAARCKPLATGRHRYLHEGMRALSDALATHSEDQTARGT